MHWDDLEKAGEDEHQALLRIAKHTDRYLGSMPSRNMKAVVRLEIFTKDGFRGPGDVLGPELIPGDDRRITQKPGIRKSDRQKRDGFRDHPWWEQSHIQNRISTLVQRCARIWDTDPRIVAIQVGTFGKYVCERSTAY